MKIKPNLRMLEANGENKNLIRASNLWSVLDILQQECLWNGSVVRLAFRFFAELLPYKRAHFPFWTSFKSQLLVSIYLKYLSKVAWDKKFWNPRTVASEGLQVKSAPKCLVVSISDTLWSLMAPRNRQELQKVHPFLNSGKYRFSSSNQRDESNRDIQMIALVHFVCFNR